MSVSRSVRSLAWRGCMALLVLFSGGAFWGVGFFRVVDPAQASGDLPLYRPGRPPDEEADRKRSWPLWREPAPDLEDIFLPDLQTLPPFDLQLAANRSSGERIIRFSNSVWNSGEGVLELHGAYDDESNTVLVSQVLHGLDQDLVERSVGEFVFHREHNHWHWEGFSIYEIWTVESSGDLGELVVTSGKVGFCMLDTSRISDEWIKKKSITGLEIAERRQYGQCGWRRQGISTGWVDTYDWDTPGQVMDVSNLSDGLYALLSTVDPDRLLLESDKENNTAIVFFLLREAGLLAIGEDLTGYLASLRMQELYLRFPGVR